MWLLSRGVLYRCAATAAPQKRIRCRKAASLVIVGDPSDVNTSLDGSTYPRWFGLVENIFFQLKTQHAKSGTSAATYKLMEPHY